MLDLDLVGARRLLVDGLEAATSFNNILELKFLPRSIIEKWMLARSAEDVSNVIEEVVRTYSKLNSWQRNDARADIPRAALQMFTSMKVYINEQVLLSCIRFLTALFEEHSDMFSMCTDIILLRILGYVDDERLPVQGIAVKCLSVFITNVTFNNIVDHMANILGDKDEEENGNVEAKAVIKRSASRLKLVTLSVLALNREVVTGVSSLTPDYQKILTDLTRNVVNEIFRKRNTADRSDYGESGSWDISESGGDCLSQQQSVSAAIDLIAASSLVLCPRSPQRSLRSSCVLGSTVDDSTVKKIFYPDFTDDIFKDDDGVPRVGLAIQDEIQRRIADKKFPSLDNDENVADLADLLLLYVDNDNPLLSLPPALHRSLLLYVPAFEIGDSLSTTAESITISSGKMHSTNGTEISPLRCFSSSSNANTPVTPYAFIEDGNASGSIDGVETDMDRTKLCALKKSQSRGGSRKQRRMGSTSCTSVTSTESADLFNSRRTDTDVEAEYSGDSRSPGTSGIRPKQFFSKMSQLAGYMGDVEVINGPANPRRRSQTPSRSKERNGEQDSAEFDECSVLPRRNCSFYRPTCLIDTLVEGDGDGDGADMDASRDADVDADADIESENDYDNDEFQEEGGESVHADEDTRLSVESQYGQIRDAVPCPEVLALAGESFFQGLGSRTAEERTRNHENTNSNHNSYRSDRAASITYPQTPSAVASYAPNGMRTQGLVLQGVNQGRVPERTGKRSIAIALSLAKESRQLMASPSLPNTCIPSDVTHSHDFMRGASLGMLQSLPQNTSGSLTRCSLSNDLTQVQVRKSIQLEKEWDNSYPTISCMTSTGKEWITSYPNSALEPLAGLGSSLTRKSRTLQLPSGGQRESFGSQLIHSPVPSSSSSQQSSPVDYRTNHSNTTSAQKNDYRSITKEKDKDNYRENEYEKDRFSVGNDEKEVLTEHHPGPNLVQGPPLGRGSGQREYQLAGETFEYLSTDAIMPSTAPQKDLVKVLQGVGVQEWPEIFHTLTTARRLGLHHSALLVSSSNTSSNSSSVSVVGSSGGNGGLHTIVLGILKQVDNLRSAVAKNALLTLGDFFQGLGKHMDQEVGLCLTHVLKRFADSSTFLVESAERALLQMMDGVTPSRSLTGLLTASEHRAPTVRGKVASVLYHLWHKKSKELRVTCFPGSKEQEIVKFRIGKLVSDQNPEARSASRNIVRFLLKEGAVSQKEWESVIPCDTLEKILSQRLVLPTPLGTTTTRSSSRMSLPCYTGVDPSPDISQESSFKSRTNGLGRTRHSTGGQMKSPPSSSASNTLLRRPTSSFQGDFEQIVRDDKWDKVKCKGDKGVSFATDDDSETGLYSIQSRTSSNLNTCTLTSNTGGGGGGGSGVMSISASRASYIDESGPTSVSTSISTSTSVVSGKVPKRRDTLGLAAKRSMECAELIVLPDLLQTVGSSTHWTERQESLKNITALVIAHWKVILDAGRLDPCVDCLLERLEDGSLKVVTCALACVQRLSDEAPGALGHSSARQLVVISSLHNTASASNKVIASNAISLLLQFVSTVPISLSVSHICAICLHEKERQRVAAYRVLTDMLTVRTNPQRNDLLSGGYIKKHIFPTICQALFGSGSKGEVRLAATETLRTLQQALVTSSSSSSSVHMMDKKKEMMSEKSKIVTDRLFSEKSRDRYSYRSLCEKNDGDSNLLWTWCRDQNQQEEIKRLTANSI